MSSSSSLDELELDPEEDAGWSLAVFFLFFFFFFFFLDGGVDLGLSFPPSPGSLPPPPPLEPPAAPPEVDLPVDLPVTFFPVSLPLPASSFAAPLSLSPERVVAAAVFA